MTDDQRTEKPITRTMTPAAIKQRGVAALKGGIYSKAPIGRRVRDRRVQRLTRKLIRACPWIDPVADMPLARAWSEAEYIAGWAFAALVNDGITSASGEPRRVFDVWRQARQLQSQLGRELALSPAARMALRVGDSTAKNMDAASEVARLKAERGSA